jgi:hypothetical protein
MVGPMNGESNVKLLLVLLVADALILIGVLRFGSTPLIYAVEVKELNERRAELAQERLRIKGVYVPGSLHSEQACRHRFLLEDPSAPDGTRTRLEVLYTRCELLDLLCRLPDEPMTLSVEGRFAAGAHLFEAHEAWVFVARWPEVALPPCPQPNGFRP